MVLLGEFAECALDVIIASVSVYAEHFIVITFCRHEKYYTPMEIFIKKMRREKVVGSLGRWVVGR